MSTKREGKNTNYLLLNSKGNIIELESKRVNEKIKVDGIIRLQAFDYETITIKQKYLTHFNLEVSYHKPGEIYALPKIIKPGY